MTPSLLFTPEKPDVYRKDQIYDPDAPSEDAQITPSMNSIIIDVENDNALLVVAAINPSTRKVTYEPARLAVLPSEDPNVASLVSYRNDVFWLFCDTNSSPVRLRPDTRLGLMSTGLEKYRLVRHRGTPEEEVVSRFYDANGNFTSTFVPMVRKSATDNTWFGMACHTTAALTPGETITFEGYNSHGGLAGLATLHVIESTIINDAPAWAPVITDLTLSCSQTRSGGEFYVFEKQDPRSLAITATLHYDDGTTVVAPIDGQKCFLYGLEDFIAAYAGMRQEILVKYYLEDTELVAPAFGVTTHLAKTATLVVVPNELAPGVKLSVIPIWNAALTRYTLRFRYYTTDRGPGKDITANVTIAEGTFDGQNFTAQQSFVLEVDLSAVDPVAHADGVVHRQPVVLRLQPVAALTRYTLRDALSSPYIYGVDSPNQRRPILRYDGTRQQYFIPSSIFLTKEAFLRSFYTAANPPYRAGDEGGPLAPTHFIVRDAASGAMVTVGQIALDDYTNAFSVVGAGGADRFVGTTVVVEFIHQIDVDTHLVLYGVPVDVYRQDGGYTGP